MSHVSLITLGVTDLEAATRFYEALGWHRSSASVAGTVAFLLGGAVPLSLYGTGDLAADSGLEGQGVAAGFRGVALAVNLPGSQDVDDLLAAAGAAGGRVTMPGRVTAWGGYAGTFADLDGHLWEVAHNPSFPLDAEGRISLPR